MNTFSDNRRMAGLLLIVAVALLAMFPMAARTSFGLKTGYITKNNSALAGLVFRYNMGHHLRLASELGIVFRNEKLDALTVDANVHFPFELPSGKVGFYPLVGLAFNSWNHHEATDSGDSDVTSHTNCLGLNGGAGVDFYCTQSLRLGFEAKYTLIRHLPNGQFTISIAYVF